MGSFLKVNMLQIMSHPKVTYQWGLVLSNIVLRTRTIYSKASVGAVWCQGLSSHGAPGRGWWENFILTFIRS